MFLRIAESNEDQRVSGFILPEGRIKPFNHALPSSSPLFPLVAAPILADWR
jgi:hypothetical protein